MSRLCAQLSPLCVCVGFSSVWGLGDWLATQPIPLPLRSPGCFAVLAGSFFHLRHLRRHFNVFSRKWPFGDAPDGRFVRYLALRALWCDLLGWVRVAAVAAC